MNQQWVVIAAGNGQYEIASAVNGLALTGVTTTLHEQAILSPLYPIRARRTSSGR